MEVYCNDTLEQQPHICHQCTVPKCVTHFLVHKVKQKAYGDIRERNKTKSGLISTTCFLFVDIRSGFKSFVYFDIFVVCNRKTSNKHSHLAIAGLFVPPVFWGFFWGFLSICQKRCYFTLVFSSFTNDWIIVSFYIHTFKKKMRL